MKKRKANIAVTIEEDGDEIFTKMPSRCVICKGKIIRKTCVKCKASYGR